MDVGSPAYKIYGGLMADRKFEPAGFKVPLGLKDIRLALTAAEDLRVPMPLASLVRDRLLSLLAQGGENRDWAAVAQLAAKDAGIRQDEQKTGMRKYAPGEATWTADGFQNGSPCGEDHAVSGARIFIG